MGRPCCRRRCWLNDWRRILGCVSSLSCSLISISRFSWLFRTSRFSIQSRRTDAGMAMKPSAQRLAVVPGATSVRPPSCAAARDERPTPATGHRTSVKPLMGPEQAGQGHATPARVGEGEWRREPDDHSPQPVATVPCSRSPTAVGVRWRPGPQRKDVKRNPSSARPGPMGTRPSNRTADVSAAMSNPSNGQGSAVNAAQLRRLAGDWLASRLGAVTEGTSS